MECLFEEYIKYTNNYLIEYYKILLGKKYERRLVKPFVDRYIEVRYYNKYSVNSKDFTSVLNKELNGLAKELMEEYKDKKEKIKNIFALFSYLLFLDGCTTYTDLNVLLKTLFADKNITLEYPENAKEDLNNLSRDFIDKKKEFFGLFNSEEFSLKEKKYEANVIKVELEQKCNLSKLFSDYAIDRAYNSEIVSESKTYLSILLLSSKVIKEVIDFDFKTNYIMDFPVSLFEKSKKIVKYIKVLDDDMLKSKIVLNFKYKDYKIYNKDINDLINQGCSVSLELDETYSIDFDNLFVFSYILVDKKYNYYDIIINSKEDVKTNVVTM